MKHIGTITIVCLAVVFALMFIRDYRRNYYEERGKIAATYVSAYVAYDVFKQTKCGSLAKSESRVEAAVHDLSPYMQDREIEVAKHYAEGPGRETLERAVNKGLSELMASNDQQTACSILFDQVQSKIKTGNDVWAKTKQTWPRLRG